MAESEASQAKVEGSGRKQYYLRVYSHPESPSKSSQVSGFYVRMHGSGTNVVMLSPGSPIYLRGHFESTEPVAEGGDKVGKQMFTSPAERHVGRAWGMMLTTDLRDTKALAGFERTEIVEDANQTGWAFEDIEVELPGGTEPATEGQGDSSQKRVVEQLVWKGGSVAVGGSETPEPDQLYEWNGWMARISAYAGGMQQLFWMTNKWKGEEFPDGCEKVIIAREWL